MGEEWLHGDINFDLVLFRVDRSKTVDDVYGESGKGEIKFLPPTEFKGMVLIGAPDNKTYSNGLGRFLEPGNMTISVYKHHLEEKGIDITYGDYIGFYESETRVRYYEVANDGKVVSDNKHSSCASKGDAHGACKKKIIHYLPPQKKNRSRSVNRKI